MDTYAALNDVLVNLFRDIMELEEQAIITQEYQDITNNDMHIIEAVGLGEGNNMTTIAKKMKITVGSLTTSMNSLVKKHYVERNRSEEDRRIVNITLTEKGIKAYKHHEEFHHRMIDHIKEELNAQETTVLIYSLAKLVDFFQQVYGENEES